MLFEHDLTSHIWGFFGQLKCNIKHKRKGFSLTEVLIALAVIAVIAVLILPVITTRAQNKSFAVSYETEVKQMLNSLEGLPMNENKDDFTQTMMFVENDNGDYSNSAGAYINKYMKVTKYCGNTPGDCFADQYYEYKDNDKVTFNMSDIKGACAQLKNGVSICLKPQIKSENGKDEIEGWIDLNGPQGPNIYGRDLRTFAINVNQKVAFTDEDPSLVIVQDPPTPCEGDDCKIEDEDPCKLNPWGRECCTKEGYVATKGDKCCIWYSDAGSGPNHLICYPDPGPGPEPEPCVNHTITGPTDECCAVLESKGIHDPNCCTEDSTSEYCCSVHPMTEGCCKTNIISGKIVPTPSHTCCTSWPSVYNQFSGCKAICELDRNSEKCCQQTTRLNEINNPSDACCAFPAVNGLDSEVGYGNPYNQYCCRLPKNASRMCCQWKSSNLMYFADYRTNGGTLDDCCHDDLYGIKSKNNDILSRCCKPGQEQSDPEEDESCCDYQVAQQGDNKLLAGQSLRHCCKYSKHKNKPQCCSNTNDGMTYNNAYNSQCCMPNSMYNTDVTPDIRCCFAGSNISGETDGFWKNSRYTKCCEYGSQTYNGAKANTQSQWQLNCCDQGRAKYPNVSSYNTNCCTAKSGNRFSWRNECCNTLLEQDRNNNGLPTWKANCCSMPTSYGANSVYRENCCKAPSNDYERNNGSTVKEELEHCCHPNAPNPNLECCKIYKGLNGTSDTWKDRDDQDIASSYQVSCCEKSTATADYCPNSCSIRWATNNTNVYDYSRCCTEVALENSRGSVNRTKAEWKNNCCEFAPVKKAGNTDKAYASFADYRSGCCNASKDQTTKNGATNVNCCIPNTQNPTKACCEAFKNNAPSGDKDKWLGHDGEVITDTYKIACCKLGVCPDSCSIRSKSNISGNYDLPRCCFDSTMQTNHKGEDTWKNSCCSQSDASSKLGTSYASTCCDPSTNNDTGKVIGTSTLNQAACCMKYTPGKSCCGAEGKKWDNTDLGACCTFTTANDACCKAYKDNGYKKNDGTKLPYNNAFVVACCNLNPAYCENNCEARSYANSDRWNLPFCCFDKKMLSHSGDSAWKTACCSQSDASSKLGTNFAATCCDPSTNNDTGKVIGTTTLNQAVCCMKYTPGKTCCSDEGKKWDNTDSAACCSYTSANEFCCDAMMNATEGKANGTWTNETFHSKCCGIDDKYCSCATTFERGLPIDQSCCASLISKEGKAHWNNNCCMYYMDNQSALNSFAGHCCTQYGDGTVIGVNLNRKIVTCCSYKSPNEFCCDARMDAAGGANKTWGSDETFHGSCCELDDKYCSCALKYSKGKSLDAACCSELKSKAGESTWQNKCCGQFANNQSELSSLSGYCCSADGSIKGSSQTSSVCCDVSSVASEFCCNATGTWKGTKCCKGNDSTNNGKTYTGSVDAAKCCDYNGEANVTCCDAAMNAAGGANSTWDNEAFHSKCCNSNTNRYCSCKMLYDKGHSLSEECCGILKDDYKNALAWRGRCCKYYIGKESQLNNFSALCCYGDAGAVRGSSTEKSGVCCTGSQSDDYCCEYNTNQCSCEKRLQKGLPLSEACCKELANNSDAMKKCCASGGAFANSSNFSSYCCANTQGTSKTGSFDQRCCSGTSDACCLKNCAYCSCEMKWSINRNCFSPSSDCSCSTKYSSDTSWKKQCCGPTSSDNYAGFPTGTSYSVSKWASTCCTSDWNGTYYGGPESGQGEGDVECCSASSPSTWCCKQNKKYCGTCSDEEITNYPDTFDTACCDQYEDKHGSENCWLKRCCEEKSDSSSCCAYDVKYCTCVGKYDMHNDVTGCCYGNDKLTGTRWLKGCCSVENLDSADGVRDYADPQGDFAKCCDKLYYDESLNATDRENLFHEGTNCCKALGDDNKYSECKPVPQPCDLNNFDGYRDTVYYKDGAKSCCENRTDGFSDTDTWKSYCCLLKSSNYSDSFAISADNTSCCDKRIRANVYHYVPSTYVSGGCTYGGEIGKCSQFKDTALGFYCGDEDRCHLWDYHNDEATISESEGTISKKSCCIKWFGSLQASSKKYCCDNFANNLTNDEKSTCCDISATFKNANSSCGQVCGSCSGGNNPYVDPCSGIYITTYDKNGNASQTELQKSTSCSRGLEAKTLTKQQVAKLPNGTGINTSCTVCYDPCNNQFEGYAVKFVAKSASCNSPMVWNSSSCSCGCQYGVYVASENTCRYPDPSTGNKGCTCWTGGIMCPEGDNPSYPNNSCVEMNRIDCENLCNP